MVYCNTVIFPSVSLQLYTWLLNKTKDWVLKSCRKMALRRSFARSRMVHSGALTFPVREVKAGGFPSSVYGSSIRRQRERWNWWLTLLRTLLSAVLGEGTSSLWDSLSILDKVWKKYQKMYFLFYSIEWEEERHGLLTKHTNTVTTVGIWSYLTFILTRK